MDSMPPTSCGSCPWFPPTEHQDTHARSCTLPPDPMPTHTFLASRARLGLTVGPESEGRVVPMCVCVCVCQGINSNHAQTARFNNPTCVCVCVCVCDAHSFQQTPERSPTHSTALQHCSHCSNVWVPASCGLSSLLARHEDYVDVRVEVGYRLSTGVCQGIHSNLLQLQGSTILKSYHCCKP